MSVTFQNPQLHFMQTGWKGTKKVDDGIIGEFLVTIQVIFVSSFESPYNIMGYVHRMLDGDSFNWGP